MTLSKLFVYDSNMFLKKWWSRHLAGKQWSNAKIRNGLYYCEEVDNKKTINTISKYNYSTPGKIEGLMYYNI